MYINRRPCVAAAKSCDALNACFEDVETAFLRSIEPQPCAGYPESRCEDDKLIRCPGYDGYPATEPTDQVYDLSEMGKVCEPTGGGAVDPGHIACDEADYPNGETCHGPILETCVNGEILTFDCRHTDPDFVCTMREGDQGSCTLPEVEPACEGLTSSVYESGWRCNGDMAEFCISGKFLRVDCGTFASSTCSGESSQSITCTLATAAD